jgi:hypothetical protein
MKCQNNLLNMLLHLFAKKYNRANGMSRKTDYKYKINRI